MEIFKATHGTQTKPKQKPFCSYLVLTLPVFTEMTYTNHTLLSNPDVNYTTYQGIHKNKTISLKRVPGYRKYSDLNEQKDHANLTFYRICNSTNIIF